MTPYGELFCLIGAVAMTFILNNQIQDRSNSTNAYICIYVNEELQNTL